MIIYELCERDHEVVIGEYLSFGSLVRQLKEIFPSGQGAFLPSNLVVNTFHYIFQPKRYVDTFGTGFYSQSSWPEDSNEMYPRFTELKDAISFVQREGIVGGVHREFVHGKAKDGKLLTWDVGGIYTTGDMPVSLTAYLSQQSISCQNGKLWLRGRLPLATREAEKLLFG